MTCNTSHSNFHGTICSKFRASLLEGCSRGPTRALRKRKKERKDGLISCLLGINDSSPNIKYDKKHCIN